MRAAPANAPPKGNPLTAVDTPPRKAAGATSLFHADDLVIVEVHGGFALEHGYHDPNLLRAASMDTTRR